MAKRAEQAALAAFSESVTIRTGQVERPAKTSPSILRFQSDASTFPSRESNCPRWHLGLNMNQTSEFILRSLLIGAGATATIDLLVLLLKLFGIPSLNFAFLSRWAWLIPAY
jgi:hypothetical protein